MNESPALWNVYVKSEASKWNQVYGPLLEKLGLSDEKAEALRTIATNYAERLADIKAAAAGQGVTTDVRRIGELKTALDVDAESETRQLLGDAGYQELKSYERSYDARDLVGGLAVTLSYSTPLRPDQAEALVSVIARSSATFQRGDPVNLGDVDWTRVDDEAVRILDQGQLEAWQNGLAWPATQRVTNTTRVFGKAKLMLDQAFEKAKARDEAVYSGDPRMQPGDRWATPLVGNLGK